MSATAALTPQNAPANELAVQDSETPSHATRLSTPPPKGSRNRRRKGAGGQTSAAQQVASTASSSPQKDTSLFTPRRPQLAPPPPSTAQALADKINHILASLAATVGDVCKGVLAVVGFAFAVFRTPIAFVLSIYVLIWLSLQILSTERLLSPLCSNFIAMTFVPICQRINSNVKAPPVNHYTELVELQSRLENVMDLAGDNTLSWAVRSSEVAMRDLTMEVRFSDFVSKDTLVEKLHSFTTEARDTARFLQRLSSRVGGAVDTIIATDNHALKALEEIQKDETSAGSTFADLWRTLRSTANKNKRKRLAWAFERTSESTAAQLERLVTEAEVTLTSLNRLDAIQDTLHELILLEKKGVDKEGEELMAQLWTILGRNRNEVALFKQHRDLLAQMSKYRAAARDRVKATMEHLIKLSEDLSELRDRAALPALVGADSIIPLEVHLESLRLGMKRLDAFKQRTIDRENTHLQMLLGDPVPNNRRVDST